MTFAQNLDVQGKSVIFRICSYCKCFLGLKDPQGTKTSISHGACPKCHAKAMSQYDEYITLRNQEQLLNSL